MCGEKAEDLIGKTDFDFYPEEAAREFKADEDRVMSTGEPMISKVEPINLPDGGKQWILTTKIPLRDREGNTTGLIGIGQDVTRSKHLEEERDKVIAELREALERIQTLRGLLPICSWCKKIRDDEGYWHQVEVYLREHSEAEFTHGICPDCMQKLYPDFAGDR